MESKVNTMLSQGAETDECISIQLASAQSPGWSHYGFIKTLESGPRNSCEGRSAYLSPHLFFPQNNVDTFFLFVG